MKIVAFLAILFMIYLLFFRKKNPNVSDKKESDKKQNKKERELEEVMVGCEVCDTFISTKDAIIKDGKFYCSKECARLK